MKSQQLLEMIARVDGRLLPQVLEMIKWTNTARSQEAFQHLLPESTIALSPRTYQEIYDALLEDFDSPTARWETEQTYLAILAKIGSGEITPNNIRMAVVGLLTSGGTGV